MQTNRRTSRRRPVSWAFALAAVGVAGMIPWRLAPRPAIGQRDRRGEASRAREGHRAVAEAELALALARRDAAPHRRQDRRGPRRRGRGRAGLPRGPTPVGSPSWRRGAWWIVCWSMRRRSPLRGPGRRATAALEFNVNRARRDAAEAGVTRPRPSTTSPGSGQKRSWRSRPRTNWRTPGPSRPTPSIASHEPRPRRPAASAFREHRKKESDRIALLAHEDAIERRVVNEQEDRYRSAQADERGAEAKVEPGPRLRRHRRGGGPRRRGPPRPSAGRLAARRRSRSRTGAGALEGGDDPPPPGPRQSPPLRAGRGPAGGRPGGGGGRAGRGDRRVPDQAGGAGQATGCPEGRRGAAGQRARAGRGRVPSPPAASPRPPSSRPAAASRPPRPGSRPSRPRPVAMTAARVPRQPMRRADRICPADPIAIPRRSGFP